MPATTTLPSVQWPRTLAMVIFALSLAGCAALSEKVIERPDVEISNVGLQDVGMRGATLVFGVKVDNPNAFKLQLNGLKYTLEMGGKQLAANELQEPAEVPANGSSVINVPVTFKFSEVFSSLTDFAQTGASSYRIKGDARLGLFTVPFSRTGELNFKQ